MMKDSPQITSPYAPDIAQVRVWLERMIVALRFVEIVAAILALIARMRALNTELTKQLVHIAEGALAPRHSTDSPASSFCR